MAPSPLAWCKDAPGYLAKNYAHSTQPRRRKCWQNGHGKRFVWLHLKRSTHQRQLSPPLPDLQGYLPDRLVLGQNGHRRDDG
jgi:hypothetical protein